MAGRLPRQAPTPPVILLLYHVMTSVVKPADEAAGGVVEKPMQVLEPLGPRMSPCHVDAEPGKGSATLEGKEGVVPQGTSVTRDVGPHTVGPKNVEVPATKSVAPGSPMRLGGRNETDAPHKQEAAMVGSSSTSSTQFLKRSGVGPDVSEDTRSALCECHTHAQTISRSLRKLGGAIQPGMHVNFSLLMQSFARLCK